MRRHMLMMAAIATAAVVTLAGCGDAGSSGTEAPAAGAAGQGCAPVAGDDPGRADRRQEAAEHRQRRPGDQQEVGVPELIDALNKVSAVLDTTKLIALNKAVDIDRKTSKAAAAGVRHRQQPHAPA